MRGLVHGKFGAWRVNERNCQGSEDTTKHEIALTCGNCLGLMLSWVESVIVLKLWNRFSSRTVTKMRRKYRGWDS
jgi:hypothetical protein